MLPMRTSIETIESLFLSGRFEPAPVQRDYQWRAVHCRTLLADLDRTFASSSIGLAARHPMLAAEAVAEADADRIETSVAAEAVAPSSRTLDHYMLGAIVTTPPDHGTRLVFDGLQRLTTLTILIAVLRDFTEDTNLKARLEALVRTDKRVFRVRLSGRDQTLPQQIQPLGAATKLRRAKAKTDMGGRLRTATDVFRERLKPWSPERRDAFARFLLGQVLVDLQEAADVRLARQMFITGNLRGKRLDRVDLLKGQLTDIAADDAAVQRVVDAWNAARQTAGDRFEALLVIVDLLERRQPQSEDCLNELADHVATAYGPAGIEAWLKRLGEFAEDDAALEAALNSPARVALAADLWRLQLFRWSEWRPLALLWLADMRKAARTAGDAGVQKRNAAALRFARLHRACMAVTLAGFSSADRETIFIRAVKQTLAGQTPFGSGGALSFRPAQIDKIAETLRTPITDREIRTTLLRWFESLPHLDSIPAHVRDATVEHILPQRVASVPQWAAAFPDRQQRFLACNALGNLAAIDKLRNMKLRNQWYPQKQPIYAQAAADFVTLRDLPAATTWSAEDIQARTARLAETIERELGLVRFSAERS
jgi:hypothetical protein